MASLYVWGHNAASQLGLKDDEVLQFSEKEYKKYCMLRPQKNDMFKQSLIQVSPGNVSALFLFYDTENRQEMIIQGGMTVLPKDESSEKIIFRFNECEQVEDIPSLPFQVDFRIPVVKISCGDLFGSLLTVEGDVYTWGYNISG